MVLQQPVLRSFGTDLNVAVFGASGGLGAAFVRLLAGSPSVKRVHGFSRSKPAFSEAKIRWAPVDLAREETIAEAVQSAEANSGKLHLVLVATGILHDGDVLQPEKTWRALEAESLTTTFAINSIGPALIAKHVLPALDRERKTVFAALSARVGSIEDNRLGGWYAYRASKAALNMLIRTLSIELARRNPNAICVALHPGTVDTALSRPFQNGVPEGRLFAPEEAAGNLIAVLDGLTPEASGTLYAWDGSRLPA